MKNVSISVPCLDLKNCDGNVEFSERIELTGVGYQALMHTKSGYCSKCKKKMRIEVGPDAGPLGFQIFAYPPFS
jgi:hypothetical protein